MSFEHVSVLLKETVDGLNIDPDGIYVDGTMGGGGHSEEILKRLNDGLLIAIDQDLDAIAATKKRLEKYSDKFIIVHDNFSNIINVLKNLKIDKIDGLLLDLGVSSYQLDTAERGFSYMQDGELDMRMNQEQEIDAKYIVNNYSEDKLHNIIKKYGEERWAARIAKFIVEAREEAIIETTADLVQIIKNAIPLNVRKSGPHPAKRTFQAIRIEVNNELGIIEDTIKDATSVLNKKGRLSIITFHSLEDRIVKHAYKDLANDCVCPPEFPICVCDKKAELKIITRKPIVASKAELEDNPRARSAKLRVAEKK